MELFLLEHKKMWRKTGTRISVILCFAYVVIFASVLNYQWFTFGSHNPYQAAFGNDFDGYVNIRSSQAYAKAYAGELTDETVQELIKDYQNVVANGKGTKNLDWEAVTGWLSVLYPELYDPNMTYGNLMISYVEPGKVTGLYERREQAIRDFLQANGQSGKEMEYLLQMNEKVNTPFQYDWTRSWSMLLGDAIPQYSMVIALFLAIVLSSVFAGEWHDNTSSLILTMKNGWHRVACAKAGIGIAFAVELFAMIFVGTVAAQLFYLGTSGWNMSIQNIKMTAVAPMNMLQAEIYEYAYLFLGMIGFAGLVILISASVKSNVLALLFSLTVIYGPMMIVEYLPYTMQKALDLLPLVGSSADIFRTNTFNIFGKIIWSPYLLIIVPVLIGVLCIPFAIKNWSRRMRI
ncbi:MAG: ABC transporter permease [Acetatifactor sp.]|nr:ABC transporter permease [Acetatifactor sp.]